MTRRMATFRAAHPYIVCDATAAVCGLVFILYFILTAKIGVGIPDELWLYTIPFRLLHGDALLVHDWSVQQIAQLSNLIPYWLFMKFSGSADGIILFSRYLFIFVDACFYVYMYLKLRKRIGLWAVLAAFLFCAVLPPAGLCLYYYNISAMAIMLICLMLLLDETRKSAIKLLIAGFLWGIAILEEPMAVLLFFLFAAVVMVCFVLKKKDPARDFVVFSPRSFMWSACGAFAVFLLFVFAVWKTGGFPRIFNTISYYLGNGGYSGAGMLDFWKIPDVISFYGIPGVCLGLVSLGLAIYYRVASSEITRIKTKKTKHRRLVQNERIRLFAFALSCCGFAFCCIWGLRPAFVLSYELLRKLVLYQNFPLLIFPLIWFLLCREVQPNVLLIFILGFGYSMFSDISSNVMLGLGGGVTMLGGVLSLHTLTSELKPAVFATDAKKRGLRSGTAPKAAMCSVILLCVSFAYVKGFYLYLERLYPFEERSVESEHQSDAIDTEITFGPYKGLKTTRFIADINDALNRDLSVVQKKENVNVMVAGICPAAYFYMNSPVGCSNVFFERKDYALQQTYWDMFPEKIPAYIYVPDYDFYTYRNKKDYDKRIDISQIVPQGIHYDITELETGRLVSIRLP